MSAAFDQVGASARKTVMRQASATDAPLAVDLDGTLTATDTLHEGFAQWIRRDPVGGVVAALRGGRAAFKREVTYRSEFRADAVPYNPELLEYLQQAKRAGRRIGLFTAADQSIADKVASHLGLFDVVRGSDGSSNLRGPEKLNAIRETLGDSFVYAGNEQRDQPIFAEAQKVILVGNVAYLKSRLTRATPIEAEFPAHRIGMRDGLATLRAKHWTKNLLVFVAPLLGWQVATAALLPQAILLFVLMSVLASATYLINDIFDLAADRGHPTKRYRSLAAGKISLMQAAFASLGMMALVFAGAMVLPWACGLVLLSYLALTLAYSFVLKSQAIVDIVTLAILFTLRVLAGSLLVPVPASPWLLTFSMLFFLGLATIKRYAELRRTTDEGQPGIVSRGYTSQDLPLLLATGVASGFAAINVFVIYLINEQYPREIYAHPGMLWLLMPVILLWTLRMWHLTVHGRMDEDPVTFAIEDRFSQIMSVGVFLILILAWK